MLHLQAVTLAVTSAIGLIHLAHTSIGIAGSAVANNWLLQNSYLAIRGEVVACGSRVDSDVKYADVRQEVTECDPEAVRISIAKHALETSDENK
jgi:hypothetical protein